jgi:peptidoglycan hydrolase CwlO-like protein
MKERTKNLWQIVAVIVTVVGMLSGWIFGLVAKANAAERQTIDARIERAEKDSVKIEGKAEALESRVNVVEKAIISIQDDVRYIREKIDRIR